MTLRDTLSRPPPRLLGPVGRWRARRALARRDAAISAALSTMDGLDALDQFALCRSRLLVMLEGGVLPSRKFRELADELGTREHVVARRGLTAWWRWEDQ